MSTEATQSDENVDSGVTEEEVLNTIGTTEFQRLIEDRDVGNIFDVIDQLGENPSPELDALLPMYRSEKHEDEDYLSGRDFFDKVADRLIELLTSDVDPSDIILAVADYTDPDGKGAVAILKHKFEVNDEYPDKHVVYVPSGYANYVPSPIDALEFVLEWDFPEDMDVFFQDISLTESDSERQLELLEEVAGEYTLHIRDHHPWSDEEISALEPIADVVVPGSEAASSLDLGDYGELCAAEITLQTDYDEAPEHIQELAHITGVRDLWKADHPEFEAKASDISGWAFHSDFREYVDTVIKHGPDVREQEHVGTLLDEEEQKSNRKMEAAIERADFFEVHVPEPVPIQSESSENDGEKTLEAGTYTFAAVTGAYNQRSDIGEVMRNRYGVDIISIVNSEAVDVSFRTNDEAPIAEHIVVAKGGGGHPQAASVKEYDFAMYLSEFREQILDQNKNPIEEEATTKREHWVSNGETVGKILANWVSESVNGSHNQVSNPEKYR